MINNNAVIVPGKSAAGFDLGAWISDIKLIMSPACKWDSDSRIPLHEAIRLEQNWLSYIKKNGGEVLCFGRGMVELHFSAKGKLFNIFVFDDYTGTLWGDVKVGSPLSLVQQHCPLEYDDGDEMHYPTHESGTIGVAFYAEELPLNEAPDQLISGISVHDWSMNV